MNQIQDNTANSKKDSLSVIVQQLPPKYKNLIFSFGQDVAEDLEEIRIKSGAAIYLYSKGKEYRTAAILSQTDVEGILSSMLSYSVYSYQEEISKGFVTLSGGHRVGICGKAIVEDGKVRGIKEASSLNIRRSKEMIGVSIPVMQYLIQQNSTAGSSRRIRSSLIVSPPGCGKTTLLRDIIRSLSEEGFRTAVVDERSELAGVYQGVAQKDLGPRTDILDGCPKSQGITMLVRAMAPQVICCDEIGRGEDVDAVSEALYTGVSVITTAHGSNYEEMRKSKIGSLLEMGAFQRIFFLSNRPRMGTVTRILDGEGRTIFENDARPRGSGAG